MRPLLALLVVSIGPLACASQKEPVIPSFVDVTPIASPADGAPPEARSAAGSHASPRRARAGTPDLVDGFAGIHVGDTLAQIQAITGGTTSIASFEDEQAAWQSAGYDTSNEPVFAIGFDEVVSFDGTKIPLFKAFFTRGRASILKFSAYSAESVDVSRFGIEPSCFMHAPPSTVTQSLGPGFVLTHSNNGQETIWNYPDRGVSVLAQDGVVQVFDVYGELSTAERARVDAALRRAAFAERASGAGVRRP
jgi:hypothetical protein